MPKAPPSDASRGGAAILDPTARPRRLLFAWAILGVLLLLGQALYRLTPIALDALGSGELTRFQAVVTAVWVALNLYLEGYRGFQRRFVPRVVSRAHYLATRRRPPAVVFAPLFAMAYYGATKSARRAAYIVTSLVLVAILLVRTLPQPYRGMIDAGVVAGLLWGTIALILSALRCLMSGRTPGNPEVSVEEASDPPAAFMSRGVS